MKIQRRAARTETRSRMIGSPMGMRRLSSSARKTDRNKTQQKPFKKRGQISGPSSFCCVIPKEENFEIGPSDIIAALPRQKLERTF